MYFSVLYSSPSQSQGEFDTFSDKFEMTLETLAQKSFPLVTVIGDFNAKSKYWYSHDKTNFEGSSIENILYIKSVKGERKKFSKT